MRSNATRSRRTRPSKAGSRPLADLAREEKDERDDRVAPQRQAKVQPDVTPSEAASKPVRAPEGLKAATSSPAWDVHRPIKQGEAIAKAVRRSLSDHADSIRAEQDATENHRVIEALRDASDEFELLSLMLAGAVEDQYGSQPD